MNNPVVEIKALVAGAIRIGHLWAFSGAILDKSAVAELSAGSLVDLTSYGRFVARGYYNPQTDIAVRVLTTSEGEAIDVEFFKKRLLRALALRGGLVDLGSTNVYRLVHGEGDFLPGLVVDVYGDYAVLQISTAGIESLKSLLIEALQSVISFKGIVVRNDIGIRAKEGLPVGEFEVIGDVPELVEVRENGIKFAIDLRKGQKTGFFIDQREKRVFIGSLAKGKSLLNLFSYNCGFGLYAAKNGAKSTVNIDQSQAALAWGMQSYKLNGVERDEHEFVAADVFRYLQDQAELTHDIVIVDPPALAKNRKAKLRALDGYFHLNSQVFAKLKPGAQVLTCSCSNYISIDEFQAMIYRSAKKSGKKVQIIKLFTHGVDHPVNLAMPETEYLKCLFLQIF